VEYFIQIYTQIRAVQCDEYYKYLLSRCVPGGKRICVYNKYAVGSIILITGESHFTTYKKEEKKIRIIYIYVIFYVLLSFGYTFDFIRNTRISSN